MMKNTPGPSELDSALIEALARDALDDVQRRQAEQLLEQSHAGRELYRQLTAHRFPEIPSYTIIGQIGKGGFGVVYKAIHHAKERVEALKVLFSKTPLLTSYFENEVHLIAKLRHPNIATLFEAQLAAPPLYYTMEFVEGRRLNEYIKHHDVSLAQRVEIIRTVALALEYAHRQGVVHRDVKPQNILVDEQRQPHIVDFGIAKRLGLTGAASAGESTPEGAIGTLGYIAPEQVSRQSVDARADVFALGALLFHCVTGEPARYARDPKRVLELLRERKISEPEDLGAIVARAVAEAPDQRYASARALADDLDNYLAGRQIVARGKRSLWRRGQRVGALVLRQYPLAVRFAALGLLAALLTPLYDSAGMRIETVGGEPKDQTVIIAFAPPTEQAITEGRLGAEIPGLGLKGEARRSLRALHGRLLQRLAAAARPRVVAFDMYFTKCSEYDDAFLAGVQALEPLVPVLIASESFDINGKPSTCPKILAGVRGVGSIHSVRPDLAHAQYEYVQAVRRGFEEPIPSLTTLAYGAFRFPGCDISLAILDKEDPARLQVRYRKRAVGNAEEQRFMPGFDLFPIERFFTVPEQQSWDIFGGKPPTLRPGDLVVHGRVPARTNEYWSQRTIAYEAVFSASDDELRAWFDDKAVVIGQMIPGIDQFDGAHPERVFGCQVHADVLSSLLGPVAPVQLAARAVAMRVLFWCALAGVLASRLPVRRRQSVALTILACAVLTLSGLSGGVAAAVRASSPWSLELGVGISTCAAALGIAYALRFLGQRQTLLAPAAVTFAIEESSTTLSSTLQAQTPA